MRGYDWIIGLAALLASLLVHALLFLNSGSVAGNTAESEPARKATRVSFRSATSPQTLPQPAPAQPQTPPEPEVTEAPEPPPTPQPPKPEKRSERARQPAPVAQPPETAAQSQPATTAEAQKSPAAAEAVTGSVADPAVLEQAKQEYLRRLMAHIESHKRYPRAARRRGIEGDVVVAFTLTEGGGVSGLDASGAHRVLLAAAREAVSAAEPLPVPPSSLPLPWPVSITMRFTLR